MNLYLQETGNCRDIQTAGIRKGWLMDPQTHERLERLEDQMGRINSRLEAVEKVLNELKSVLRQQGIEQGRNYAAP